MEQPTADPISDHVLASPAAAPAANFAPIPPPTKRARLHSPQVQNGGLDSLPPTIDGTGDAASSLDSAAGSSTSFAPPPATSQTTPPSARPPADHAPQFRAFHTDDTAEFDGDALLDAEQRTALYDELQRTFGFRAFRHCQRAVVQAALLGHDCCVLMPTGAGKSLCFQLPALLGGGVTVVISPLRSLMADQVAKLRLLQIGAECLLGNTKASERTRIFADLAADAPRTRLLYVTPEMVGASAKLRAAVERLHRAGRLDRFVVDEAHCVSEWGHDFRPDYARLTAFFAPFRSADRRTPLMAVTATATPRTLADVRRLLGMPQVKTFVSSFVRDNLVYDLMEKTRADWNAVLEFVKERYPQASGIVYCLSRKDCSKVESQLRRVGLSAAVYHAELPNAQREETQRRWMAGEIKVLCATVAFGMGIDKPDVRFVIHHSFPQSIEAYYQESGRAGRDGLPAHCVVMYTFADYTRLLVLIEKDGPLSTALRTQRLHAIHRMVAYCETVAVCRRKLLVEHFGEGGAAFRSVLPMLLLQIFDSERCKQSAAPCSVCARPEVTYELFDLTREAFKILQSVQQLREQSVELLRDRSIGQLVQLFLGWSKRPHHLEVFRALPMWAAGASLPHADVSRLFRRLVHEELLEIAVVPHRHHLEHVDVFRACRRQLWTFRSAVAQRQRTPLEDVLSNEGVEQLAALLPRTRSDFLQVDSMTAAKFELHGAQLAAILRPFGERVDRRDHDAVKRQVVLL